MRNLKTVLLGMSLAVSFYIPVASAQPKTWQDVDMNRQSGSSGRDTTPNFDDLNRTGAGWENTPPVEHLPAPPRRNTNSTVDFGAGQSASDVDPGQTGTAAIKSTRNRLQKLDQAEGETKEEQDDLADGLRVCQKLVDRDTNYYAELIAIGEMAPEDVAQHVKLGLAIVREIKQRLAETGKTLQRIRNQRAALSQQLEIMQSRQQWPNAFQTSGSTQSVAQRPPAAGCTLAGDWSNQVLGIGSSNWSITSTGVAREGGMGGATGQATLVGRTLTIEWTTAIGQAGTYVIQLNDTCTSGKGTMHQTKAPPGIKLLTGDSYFTRR